MIGERNRAQSETLREIREQLRAYEDSQFAQTAETLARTVEALERSLERLDTSESEILSTFECTERDEYICLRTYCGAYLYAVLSLRACIVFSAFGALLMAFPLEKIRDCPPPVNLERTSRIRGRTVVRRKRR